MENLFDNVKKYFEVEKNQYFKNDLQKVIDLNNLNELNDRFYRNLEFGTAGLRGVIGGGFNRINNYTISRATQGLANYVNLNVKGDKYAVVAHDSRNFSKEFALMTALVFCANGIKTYLFPSLRSTPELSFAISHLKATIGVNITASHNPPEYNGYKVFWSNGSQIIAPHDTGIVDEVLKIDDDIKYIEEKIALEKKLLIYLDDSVDTAFINMVEKYSIRKDLFKKTDKGIKIVYTPLNGAGKVPILKIFNKFGINVLIVKEQAEPDGNFPTTPFPNPEIHETLDLAIKLAKKEEADLVIGTDPDADRISIAIPDATKEWKIITGNQLGCIIAYYIISAKKEKNLLKERSAIVKTIVSTNLIDEITEKMGIKLYKVLTGFKWIAKQIEEIEDKGIDFLMAFEESCGYLIEKEVKDKDAVSAAFIIAEILLYCKTINMSLLDFLNKIYDEFGYFEDFTISKDYKGQEGGEIIKKIMDTLRANPPSEIAGIKVCDVIDYNNPAATKLPKSNVLGFILEDKTGVYARPSGTEPKIKFYCSCGIKKFNNLDEAKKRINLKIEAIKQDIKKILV